jgi:streptomycin 6-kinase
MFEPYLQRWVLVADGEATFTHTSGLLPVLKDGVAAMLKVTGDADERHGNILMRWWDGQGAARVLAHEEGALLLERACGVSSLVEMATGGRDEAATRIICEVASRLHAPRGAPPEGLVPLRAWFEALFPAARAHGGLLARSAELAEPLLAAQGHVVPLHGDLHHENILDFGPRGWLAIDPKRLIGDRCFEYAILFCDPDLSDPAYATAIRPEIFARRLDIVGEAAGIERTLLLRWIASWTGLSAAWDMGDGNPPEVALRVLEMAVGALDA